MDLQNFVANSVPTVNADWLNYVDVFVHNALVGGGGTNTFASSSITVFSDNAVISIAGDATFTSTSNTVFADNAVITNGGDTTYSSTANITFQSGSTTTFAAGSTQTGLTQWLQFALGDQTSVITTGTKLTTRFPACTILAVRASLQTASSSGLPTINILESGVTILSTKITIDANELTSTTAVTPPVVSDAAIADDAEMTFAIDVAGTGAKGPIVSIKVRWA